MKRNKKALLPANYSKNEGVPIQFISYENNIRPIIQQKCISCHTKENRSSKIDLSHENSYARLMQYVEHQEALAIKK